MIPALQSFGPALASVDTPGSYRAASTAIRSAIALDVQAITDRNSAITARDDALFAEAVNELRGASQAFAAGYGKFPGS